MERNPQNLNPEFPPLVTTETTATEMETEVTTRPQSHQTRKINGSMGVVLVKAAVALYCLCLLAFYLMGSFSYYHALPDWLYYWWATFCGGSFLSWTVIYVLMPLPHRHNVASIVLFSAIRFLWDVISYFSGLSINNGQVVAFLFLILIVVMSVLTLKRGNFADRWLSKILFS
jgi:hypothetical protein